jgi:hypothetical protein
MEDQTGPPETWCDCHGHDHEPSRRGLIGATHLKPFDHPQFWSVRDLVRVACEDDARRRAGLPPYL